MSSKTIYMAGEYNDGVTVSSQLSNGNNAVASGKYSHAEGKDTQASGECSHSDGVNAIAKDDFSFVFNGDQTKVVESSGEGTFTVNPVGGLKGFYISGKSLSEIYGGGGGGGILGSDNEFTGHNKFSAVTELTKTELTDDVVLSNASATVNLAKGTTKVATASITSDDETAASTHFVHSLIQEYFKAILGNGVIR